MTSLRRGIVALVAFVWPFSTVRFQMSPQMACPRRSIVTLVAFVWLFSTVRFQMCPQITYPRRGIVTLVAFVWLNGTFSLFLQDFLTLQPKVIIFRGLFHCVVFCPKFLQTDSNQCNDWLLVKYHNLTFPLHTFTFSMNTKTKTQEVSRRMSQCFFSRIISTYWGGLN